MSVATFFKVCQADISAHVCLITALRCTLLCCHALGTSAVTACASAAQGVIATWHVTTLLATTCHIFCGTARRSPCATVVRTAFGTTINIATVSSATNSTQSTNATNSTQPASTTVTRTTLPPSKPRRLPSSPRPDFLRAVLQWVVRMEAHRCN